TSAPSPAPSACWPSPTDVRDRRLAGDLEGRRSSGMTPAHPWARLLPAVAVALFSGVAAAQPPPEPSPTPAAPAPAPAPLTPMPGEPFGGPRAAPPRPAPLAPARQAAQPAPAPPAEPVDD